MFSVGNFAEIIKLLNCLDSKHCFSLPTSGRGSCASVRTPRQDVPGPSGMRGDRSPARPAAPPRRGHPTPPAAPAQPSAPLSPPDSQKERQAVTARTDRLAAAAKDSRDAALRRRALAPKAPPHFLPWLAARLCPAHRGLWVLGRAVSRVSRTPRTGSPCGRRGMCPVQSYSAECGLLKETRARWFPPRLPRQCPQKCRRGRAGGSGLQGAGARPRGSTQCNEDAVGASRA